MMHYCCHVMQVSSKGDWLNFSAAAEVIRKRTRNRAPLTAVLRQMYVDDEAARGHQGGLRDVCTNCRR